MPETIYPLIFLVALAYSSVGHGGASGYLAVLALFGFAPLVMAPSALALNLLVSTTAFLAYSRAGYFVPRLFWPFAMTSIPMAFLGGLLKVPVWIYSWLLAAALLFAAIRIVLEGLKSQEEILLRPPRLGVALPAGAAIGFLSGLLGVGGGIFLSPILLLMRWADTKRTAAASAAFIWVNSAAGLYGPINREGLDIAKLWPLVLAAFLGGLLGSQIGARRLRGTALRFVLAGVLVVAALKISWTSL
jgi:uncharacterized membrane protein YfcA